MSVFTLSRLSAVTFGFFSLFNLVSSANAAIINGNFSNELDNWNVSGDVAVFDERSVLTNASSTNADDPFDELLLNLPDSETPLELSPVTFNISGNDVTGIADLETFLGVDPLALNPADSTFGAFEGSAIAQTFTANTGDRLNFDWNFLTNEDSSNPSFANDTAFLVLRETSRTKAQVTSLADLNSSLSDSLESFDSFGFAKETGTNSYSQSLIPGEYVLGLVVVDDINSTISSALLLDEVSVTNDSNPTPTNVPEPATVFALLTTLVLSNRVKSKKK